MKYEIPEYDTQMPLVVMEKSAFSSNRCVFRDDERGILAIPSELLGIYG